MKNYQVLKKGEKIFTIRPETRVEEDNFERNVALAVLMFTINNVLIVLFI